MMVLAQRVTRLITNQNIAGSNPAGLEFCLLIDHQKVVDSSASISSGCHSTLDYGTFCIWE